MGYKAIKGDNMSALSDYTKQKRYAVCVDSDGCAMDTMNIKHIRCFGPLLVEEWGLEAWREEIPELSNEAVKKEAGRHPIFGKALKWSEAVNRAIRALPQEEIRPFEHVLEALARFVQGRYAGLYQEELVKRFAENLGL